MVNTFPKLRHHARKRKSGRVVIYYFYDMRGTGKPDVPLGTDYDQAIVRWEEIHNHQPRIAGTLEEAFARWEQEVLPGYKNKGTRDGYVRHLRKIRPAFGMSTWDAISVSHLKGYLKARSAKTQANREMSLLSIVWNWARLEGLTDKPWPAAGMERSGWKNKEKARTFEVTDDLFDSVYDEADQVLKDCMDISTATALRITDAYTILMPVNGKLIISASKTGKPAYFEIESSPTLSAILRRRESIKADHDMFLSTSTGRKVTYSMLRARWEEARESAAKKAEANGNETLAKEIRKMFLRDMRKRASDMVETIEEASQLLQHSSIHVTRKHYRTRPEKLRTVR